MQLPGGAGDDEVTAARAAWEVTAGIIPGEPMPEHTKCFVLTSDEWDGGSEHGAAMFKELRERATKYADSLQHPAYLNWVRLDWVWF
jgi:hypothetical protein